MGINLVLALLTVTFTATKAAPPRLLLERTNQFYEDNDAAGDNFPQTNNNFLLDNDDEMLLSPANAMKPPIFLQHNPDNLDPVQFLPPPDERHEVHLSRSGVNDAYPSVAALNQLRSHWRQLMETAKLKRAGNEGVRGNEFDLGNVGFEDNGNELEEDKRSAVMRATMARRSQGKKRKQGTFKPTISVGALMSLEAFFNDIQNNIELLEKKKLSKVQHKLLDGKYPNINLKKEINDDPSRPVEQAAFINAVRTYVPSAKLRELVSMVPDGYRGTNYYDPNYMMVGLGK